MIHGRRERLGATTPPNGAQYPRGYRAGSPTALDDVEFLASSENRVEVLHALATGPFSRSDLHDRTGISQPTLGRILEGFTERGWVEKVGRQFRLTHVGGLLAGSFDQLLATVTTVQRLADLEARLPVEEMPFDFEAFADASVTTPRAPDVFAHVRRVEELVRAGRELRWLTNNVFFESVGQQRELLLDGDRTQEVVIADDAFEVLCSRPDLAAIVRELLESGALSVYRFPETVPCGLGLVDGRAVVVPTTTTASRVRSSIPTTNVSGRGSRRRSTTTGIGRHRSPPRRYRSEPRCFGLSHVAVGSSRAVAGPSSGRLGRSPRPRSLPTPARRGRPDRRIRGRTRRR